MAVFCEKFTKKNIDKLLKQKPLISQSNINNNGSKISKSKEKSTLLQNYQTNIVPSITENQKEDKKE